MLDSSLCSPALKPTPSSLDPDAAQPAPVLPGFTVGEALGQGGFAKVWAARRDADGAPLAVKVAHARGAVTLERFRREGQALERVGPPHVPRLYHLGQLSDGRPYLAMERRFERTL